MKQLRQLSRTKPAIPESLNRRLNSYALAAGAAGVSLLATARPAEAEIVFTSAQVEILPNSTFPIDLNHDGTNDFFLYHNEHSSISGVYRGGFLVLNGGSVSFLARKSYREPLALPKGRPIGEDSRAQFDRIGGQVALMANAFCYPLVPLDCQMNGAWEAATKKYLGLRFVINGEVHYGWARLTVTALFWPPLHMVRARLTGYAYETEPNKTIKAGDTGAADDAALGTGDIPDASTMQPASAPGTLGALAQGSQGLQRWRKRSPTQGSNSELSKPADH